MPGSASRCSVFFAVAGAAARPASAASVSPIAHSGNVTEKDNGCPAGDIVIDVDGSKTSGSAGGVTITVTYHDDNSLDFSATGGLVDVAYVKGGPNYNEYDYNPAVASDTNLVSPLNGGDQVPAVSHSVYCVEQNQTTTTSTSSLDQSTTSSTSTTSSETSSVSETTESTVTSESSSVSESTQTTATTETSDVSDTTSTQQTTTTTDGNSTTESGGVGGETGTPDVTPPSTSTLPGSSGSSDGWRVILLALAGVAVLSLVLLPGEGRRASSADPALLTPNDSETRVVGPPGSLHIWLRSSAGSPTRGFEAPVSRTAPCGPEQSGRVGYSRGTVRKVLDSRPYNPSSYRYREWTSLTGMHSSNPLGDRGT